MTVAIPILPEEKELFTLLSHGDQVAFTKIFDYYEPRIYPFVFKITKSETAAEEIVQELFIKLWNNRAKAAEIEHPRAYIFRMAVNRTASYLKTLARQVHIIEKASGDMIVERNVTEEMVDLKATEEVINKAVALLPEQQRKVYELSRRYGLSNDDIAKELNISRHTVKNHLTQALRFIREQLQHSPGAAIALIVFLVKNSR